MSKLDWKLARITGGKSGSVSTANRCVNDGAYVFVTGRHDAELNTALKGDRREMTGVQGGG